MPPCLAHWQENQKNIKSDSTYELNNDKEAIQAIPTTRTKSVVKSATLKSRNTRHPKYLECNMKREKSGATSKIIELAPSEENFLNYRPADVFTKTVLITKLEKYTDHEVTATLKAMNCLPVDRGIPMCFSQYDLVKEIPDESYEGKELIFSKFDENIRNIIIKTTAPEQEWLKTKEVSA